MTLHPASKMRPLPTCVYLNLGMTYPVVGKLCASWGVPDLSMVDERAMWPMSRPTCTVGAKGSSLRRRTPGAY